MKLRVLIVFGLVIALRVSAQGVIPETDTDIASFPGATQLRGIRALPSHAMLSDFPKPGYQGRTSTCVAWSVAYAASYFHRASLHGQTLSPAFLYALGNGDPRCLDSSRTSRVLDALRDVGAVPQTDYVFDSGWCGRTPTVTERRRAELFRVPGWGVLPAGDLQAARTELAGGRPVIFSMPTGVAFEAYRGDGTFDKLDDLAGAYWHSMVAIGFDDEKQAFRIQNSAGRRWGDNGQAWLSFRLWKERTGTGYVIFDRATDLPR